MGSVDWRRFRRLIGEFAVPQENTPYPQQLDAQVVLRPQTTA